MALVNIYLLEGNSKLTQGGVKSSKFYMNQNKKTVKPEEVKKGSAESPNTKKLNNKDSSQNADKESSNQKWGNMFDFSDNGITEQMKSFMNSGVGSLCGSGSNNSYDTSTANNMMSKLSNNIKHNFEQNMELSQDVLKCKTAADFIEFQRKNFETNYKNNVKLLNDLFYDVQNLTNQNVNIMKKKSGSGV